MASSAAISSMFGWVVVVLVVFGWVVVVLLVLIWYDVLVVCELLWPDTVLFPSLTPGVAVVEVVAVVAVVEVVTVVEVVAVKVDAIALEAKKHQGAPFILAG